MAVAQHWFQCQHPALVIVNYMYVYVWSEIAMVGAIGLFRAVSLLLFPCSDAKSGTVTRLLRLRIRICRPFHLSTGGGVTVHRACIVRLDRLADVRECFTCRAAFTGRAKDESTESCTRTTEPSSWCIHHRSSTSRPLLLSCRTRKFAVSRATDVVSSMTALFRTHGIPDRPFLVVRRCAVLRTIFTPRDKANRGGADLFSVPALFL